MIQNTLMRTKTVTKPVQPTWYWMTQELGAYYWAGTTYTNGDPIYITDVPLYLQNTSQFPHLLTQRGTILWLYCPTEGYKGRCKTSPTPIAKTAQHLTHTLARYLYLTMVNCPTNLQNLHFRFLVAAEILLCVVLLMVIYATGRCKNMGTITV